MTRSRADWEPRCGVQAQHNQNPILGTGLEPRPVTDCLLLWQQLQQAGGVWPPAPSHEPPQPHCPREAHWVLLGLPGKQLLFCSLLDLARAVAGSRSISLSPGLG